MHREITEITDRPPQLIGQLLEVWERSVRATHLFLSAGEVAEIKPYVPQALREVPRLIVARRADGTPAGFMCRFVKHIGRRTLRGKASQGASWGSSWSGGCGW